MNNIPDQFHSERLIRARAQDGELDGGTGLTPHEIDGVLKADALHGPIVDTYDQVSRLEPGPLGRGVIDGRNHLNKTILQSDLNPQAAKFPAGAHLEFPIFLAVQIGRMRV